MRLDEWASCSCRDSQQHHRQEREGRKEERGKYIYMYNLVQISTHNAPLTHIHKHKQHSLMRDPAICSQKQPHTSRSDMQ